jgi:hypothetical protein
MEFRTHAHRHADVVLARPEFASTYEELTSALTSISELEIANHFKAMQRKDKKSISQSINALIKENLGPSWNPESPIFQDNEYTGNTWRLDFAKGLISVEVAFNNGGSISWNLLKPVLASELNHVNKKIQTQVGVIICATKALKQRGGFDSAIGDYEKYLRYLKPLQNVLTTPILFIGLEPPVSFRLDPKNNKGVIIYEPDGIQDQS